MTSYQIWSCQMTKLFNLEKIILQTDFPFKVVRNDKCENFYYFITFFLPLDGNETLYSYRTWEYTAKTKAKIFLTVIVSMVTVR